MKKYITRSTFLAATLVLSNIASAAVYFDDFSSDSSANYIYTTTFDPDNLNDVTWGVSGGTLNVPITGGADQTANLFYNTAIFGIGDTVSVDASGGSDLYLSVSTTTRAANAAGQDGVRLNWTAVGFRARNYTNGTGTNLNFNSAFSVPAPAALTLFLTRETDNTFSAAFDSGSGLTQLNTTGGAEKQIFAVGDTGNGDLFIGVETFDPGVRTFDNLTVTAIPEPSSTALLGLSGLGLILRRRK